MLMLAALIDVRLFSVHGLSLWLQGLILVKVAGDLP